MTQRGFYAHSLKNQPQSQWHPLREHLNRTASLAAQFASVFKASTWARTAGLWHDIGKYSSEYQRRLTAIAQNPDDPAPKVDHSTAGAQNAVSRFKDPGKILAYVIAGHHSGMPDGKSVDSCLATRLEKAVPDYSACPNALLKRQLTKLPFSLDMQDPRRAAFQLSFFTRMLFSCLVDADFLDTESFMRPYQATWRGGYPTFEQLAQRLDEALNRLAEDAADIPINRYRSSILRDCRRASDQPPGLFSLTVPTGGGKTLSSLAFAINHALLYEMERVIYVIPYTSIIEQNADVFRKALGNNAVLEHHSNFDPPDGDRKSRLSAENWDAPIIVTTNVQFFESIFHNRTSKCRKLHNLAKSAVVLDEAQMLPSPLLKPCIEALRELTTSYGTTVVLCTATQPALNTSGTFMNGLNNVREIISDPVALYTAFKRVNAKALGRVADNKLVDRLKQSKQVLCIVNMRKHAGEIYRILARGEDRGCYHLSALMCPAHRTEVLEKIKQALLNGEPCQVISTQLIEAGVDIDFPVVFRASAGLDSVAQAAGRCNREGRITSGGQLFVFEPEEILPPGYFRETAQVARSVMRRYRNFLSMDAVTEYFREYYWMKGDLLDEYGILDDIAEGAFAGDFPFKRVCRKFKIIDEDTESLIVPWDSKAEGIIENLRDTDVPGMWIRKAQRYTVQLRPKAFQRLLNLGAVEQVRDQYNVLINMSYYQSDVGIIRTER